MRLLLFAIFVVYLDSLSHCLAAFFVFFKRDKVPIATYERMMILIRPNDEQDLVKHIVSDVHIPY